MQKKELYWSVGLSLVVLLYAIIGFHLPADIKLGALSLRAWVFYYGSTFIALVGIFYLWVIEGLEKEVQGNINSPAQNHQKGA